MKSINLFVTLFFIVLLIACNSEPCINPNRPSACQDIPPTDEPCFMGLTNWFYDETTNTCNKITYGGCNFYGFSTKEECKECSCND